MADFAIGVDLGGTNLRAAAITHDGALLEDFQVATEAAAGRDKVASNIIAGIRQVRAGHDGDTLLGVGLRGDAGQGVAGRAARWLGGVLGESTPA